jgi:hypothetical protein
VSTWNSSANFSYAFTLGKKQVTSGGGVQIMGGPGGLTVNPTAAQTMPRYRLNLNVGIQNLFKAHSRRWRAPDHVQYDGELLAGRNNVAGICWLNRAGTGPVTAAGRPSAAPAS